MPISVIYPAAQDPRESYLRRKAGRHRDGFPQPNPEIQEILRKLRKMELALDCPNPVLFFQLDENYAGALIEEEIRRRINLLYK